MKCKSPSCVAFRTNEPELAARMHKARIIAHHMTGNSEYCEFYLSGITPVPRSTIMAMLAEWEGKK